MSSPLPSLLVKPVGDACNLACGYCFYRGHGPDHAPAMSPATLARVMRQAEIACGVEVPITFQGGEPTLAGREFFALARELAPCADLALQTNGSLLDESWCAMLAEDGWLVGLSIDGPADLHDAYRTDRAGAGSHALAARAADRLSRAGASWTAMVAVHRANQDHGRRVWRHVAGELGAEVVQLIPVTNRGSEIACTPEGYAAFVREVAQEWNAGARQVWLSPLSDLAHGESACCALHQTCGTVPVIERDGSVYVCDHYVQSWHLLGNVMESELDRIIESRRLRAFGQRKRDELAAECRSCALLTKCWGGCPKDRTGPWRESVTCLGMKAAVEAVKGGC